MKSKNGNRGIHLFALKLGPRLVQYEWETFLSALPNEERERIMNYTHWQNRQRALLGNVLVRWMIRRFTDVQPIQIERNDSGRPYLAGNANWQGDFNLSHSGEWIAAALITHGRVGIDVEEINQLNEELMAFALSEAECNTINEKSGMDKVNLFYEFWTKKEAIYKTGLFPDATPQSLDTVLSLQKCKDIYTQLFYVDSQHPVSICWNTEMPFPELMILNRYQLV